MSLFFKCCSHILRKVVFPCPHGASIQTTTESFADKTNSVNASPVSLRFNASFLYGSSLIISISRLFSITRFFPLAANARALRRAERASDARRTCTGAYCYWSDGLLLNKDTFLRTANYGTG